MPADPTASTAEAIEAARAAIRNRWPVQIAPNTAAALARVAVEAAAPILLAAGRTAAAADLPSDTAGILAWLERHGLSTTPGVGPVLAAVRSDLTEGADRG